MEHRPSYHAESDRLRAILASRTATNADESDFDGDGSYDIDDEPGYLDNAVLYREREYYYDIDFVNELGGSECWREMAYSRIHCATRQGHTEIVEILLDNGADTNSISNHYCSCNEVLVSQVWNLMNKPLGSPWINISAFCDDHSSGHLHRPSRNCEVPFGKR